MSKLIKSSLEKGREDTFQSCHSLSSTSYILSVCVCILLCGSVVKSSMMTGERRGGGGGQHRGHALGMLVLDGVSALHHSIASQCMTRALPRDSSNTPSQLGPSFSLVVLCFHVCSSPVSAVIPRVFYAWHLLNIPCVYRSRKLHPCPFLLSSQSIRPCHLSFVSTA